MEKEPRAQLPSFQCGEYSLGGVTKRSPHTSFPILSQILWGHRYSVLLPEAQPVRPLVFLLSLVNQTQDPPLSPASQSTLLQL